MQDKLDKIRWDRLRHAYGNASDLPGLLLGLASKNPEERSESSQTLCSTIWHQGMVCSATIAAVPFLCELLRDANVQDKEDILGLLSLIQLAYPRSDVKLDPIWREKPSVLELKQHAKSAKWARLAKRAVSAEADTYILMLDDLSPQVRQEAALILAGCGRRSVNFRRQLENAIDQESDADVKTALINAWYRGPRGVRKSRAVAAKLRTLAFNTQEKPEVRVASAFGLIPFLKERARAKIIRILVSNYRRCAKILDILSRRDEEFDPLDQVRNNNKIRLELFLEISKKPNRLLKNHLCVHLPIICRDNRSNFAKLIPVFGQFLSDNDSEFRERVARNLSQMGTWSRFARTHLIQALKDSNPMVALWSAVALSKLRDPHVLPFVLENLAPERHVDVQEIPKGEGISLAAINRVGKQLQYLRELLNALRPFGSDGHEALPQLGELLTKRGKHIQELVCASLAVIGEPAREMVPIVGSLLKNSEIRGAAASALMQWGALAVDAIPDLMEYLNGHLPTDSWATSSAITALGRMGTAAECALPFLIKSLSDPDFQMKCEAALTIWKIAPGTQIVIDTLIAELHVYTKPGWAIHGCIQVIKALEQIGPAAHAARPMLKKLLDDSNGWARVYSARALWKIGTDPNLILPVLIDDLLCKPLGINAGILAAECLADIGQPAATAIPRLKEILARNDSFEQSGTDWVECDESYRKALIHALVTISGDNSYNDEYDESVHSHSSG